MAYEIKNRFTGRVIRDDPDPGANLRDADLRGDLSGADLSDAYLRGVDLQEANLRGADLSGADLSDAYLRGVDLSDAHLRGADLRDADLRGADLRDADLRGADLRGADLRDADLRGADLRDADLRGADLRGADLRHADLSGADLSGANLPEGFVKSITFARTRILPDDGDVIGWKKCVGGVLVKLRIPADARRSHAFGRKCRAERAEVLEVFGAEVGQSSHDARFMYAKGQTVSVDNFSEDWCEECAPGIHFFITRAEAEAY